MLNFHVTFNGGWGVVLKGGARRGHIITVVIGLTGITFLNSAISFNMYQVDGLSPDRLSPDGLSPDGLSP